MIKTEKRHWLSGYQERGSGTHKTFALKLFNFGIMITNYKNKMSIDFYKLTK